MKHHSPVFVMESQSCIQQDQIIPGLNKERLYENEK
jgi:hypothetical protein